MSGFMDKIKPEQPTWTTTVPSANARLERWLRTDSGWRNVQSVGSGDQMAFEVVVRAWRTEGGGQADFRGEGDTIDAAIHAALDAAGAER